MVTPVYDPHWKAWASTVEQVTDAFSDYLAPAFVEYLGRGWCRLEMFFSSNVPMSAARCKLFGGELGRVMREEKRRPHLVFGTRELELGEMPLILRALRDDEFARYHPGEGYLFDKRDAVVINAYVEELFKINAQLKVHVCIVKVL